MSRLVTNREAFDECSTSAVLPSESRNQVATDRELPARFYTVFRRCNRSSPFLYSSYTRRYIVYISELRIKIVKPALAES